MKQIHRQRGLVLLLIVLSMLAILGTVMLAGIANSGKTERNIDVAVTQFSTASDLKQAIFGYILSAPISSTYSRPGAIPMPDTLEGSYNGQSDAACLSSTAILTNGRPPASNNAQEQRCIGRWPWQVIPIDLSSASRDSAGNLQANDPNGAIPWLAVSANLAQMNLCLKKLNSDVLNLNFTSFSCPAAANSLPHPWLTVRDASGAILTQSAAVVIIIPGSPLNVEGGYAQVRASNLAPGNPKDYLDKISLPLGCTSSCTSTFDNAGLNNQFIQISPNTIYPSNAEDATKKGAVPFNDIIAYITIDELMPIIEKRVLAEMKSSLASFRSTPGITSFPWAAVHAVPTNDSVFVSAPDTIVGMFPFFPVPPTQDMPTGQPTNFNWSISSGFSSLPRNCQRVRTSPSSRWVNLNQNTLTQIGTSGSATGTTVWRGVKPLVFQGNSSASTFSKTFTAYSTLARCTSNGITSGSLNYNVNRTLNFNVDVPDVGAQSCTGTLSRSYFAATISQYNTTSWACSGISSPSSFGISVIDVLTSPVAASVTQSLNLIGSINVSGMRYQPLIGDWFFDEGWYKQAFYAVANNSAPAVTTNKCIGIPFLNVGGVPAQAIVMLSGKSLSNATRPSMPLADYLESANSNAATNCNFESITKPISSTYNDQIVIVSQ